MRKMLNEMMLRICVWNWYRVILSWINYTQFIEVIVVSPVVGGSQNYCLLPTTDYGSSVLHSKWFNQEKVHGPVLSLFQYWKKSQSYLQKTKDIYILLHNKCKQENNDRNCALCSCYWQQSSEFPVSMICSCLTSSGSLDWLWVLMSAAISTFPLLQWPWKHLTPQARSISTQ